MKKALGARRVLGLGWLSSTKPRGVRTFRLCLKPAFTSANAWPWRFNVLLLWARSLACAALAAWRGLLEQTKVT